MSATQAIARAIFRAADAVSLAAFRAATGREPLPMVAGIEDTSEEFKRELCVVADNLSVPPEWIAAILSFESSGTFSPTIRNPYSGAVGILQWMPAAASFCGTTQDELEQMTATEQLLYVERYMRAIPGAARSLTALYCLVLAGKLIRDDSEVLFKGGSVSYSQNHALDPHGLGVITARMAAEPVFRVLERGYERGEC